MSDTFDVLQAFVDDEPFDPAALDRALADPEGRAELIDLIALRNLTRRSVPATLTRSTTLGRNAGGRWLSFAAAAAVTLLAGTAGYIAGERTRPAAPPVQPPAVIDTIVADAPPPAHVIRLEPGVDWVDRSGGRLP
jgi:hypothetical protein